MNPSNLLAGIDPGELGRGYLRRGLDGLSDVDLLDAVVGVLREPRDRMTSFTLHTPLEALARYSLLPYVRPEYHELARTQLVAVAGLFQAIPAAPAIDRFIAPMVLATEGAHAEDVGAWFPSGPFEDCDAVFAAITRVAAASMLQDERSSAKYGWTHCLTIPHGLWSIIDHVTDRTGALWLASTVAYAFRATGGRSVVAPEVDPERTSLALRDALLAGPEAAASAAFHARDGEVKAARTELATQAAIRNDAHLVKYTLACLDVATMDPAYARLYHAAAAYLVSVWMATTPAESLLENLATDRTWPWTRTAFLRTIRGSERCQSGRMGLTRNQVCPCGHPGFESLPLRHMIHIYY